MALTKRLRFEVLRRDNHACRYCGRSAPAVKLAVDHVVPVALGGTDEPSNLVASCGDCNIGKSSSAPDQRIVDDADQKAVQWAAAIAVAAEEMLFQEENNQEAVQAFDAAWPTCYRNRLPSGYRESVNQIAASGLPKEIIAELAKVAAFRPGVANRFRYFCGCCNKKIQDMQERALQLVTATAETARDQQIMDEIDNLEVADG